MRLSSDLTIEVTASPGLDIDSCAFQMIRLAYQLRQNVKVNFNDVVLIASPDGIAATLADNYRWAIAHNEPYKTAGSLRLRK